MQDEYFAVDSRSSYSLGLSRATSVKSQYGKKISLVKSEDRRQAQVKKVTREQFFLVEFKLEPLLSNRTFCVKYVDVQTCTADSDKNFSGWLHVNFVIKTLFTSGGFFVEFDNVWSVHEIFSRGLIEEKCTVRQNYVYMKQSTFGDRVNVEIEHIHSVW